jgi:hypothetical protein
VAAASVGGFVSRTCGRKGGSMKPGDIGDLLQLRQHMGHLIDNLQVYLHLDVIESNYDLLLQKVAAAQVWASDRRASGTSGFACNVTPAGKWMWW